MKDIIVDIIIRKKPEDEIRKKVGHEIERLIGIERKKIREGKKGIACIYVECAGITVIIEGHKITTRIFETTVYEADAYESAYDAYTIHRHYTDTGYIEREVV